MRPLMATRFSWSVFRTRVMRRFTKAQIQFHPRYRADCGHCPWPQVMVVIPSVPAKTVPEFIAYAKANPGKVNMGSAGTGSVTHLAGELFKMMAGVNLVHVPFRGNGPALTAMLGGQVEVQFPSVASSVEYIRTGKLRGLAVSGAMRSEVLPDLPTVGEFVPGYEITAWFGVGAPQGTPAEVIDKINTEITARPCRSQDKGAARRLCGCADANDADRIREIHRRRDREVGQGDPSGQSQGKLGRFRARLQRNLLYTVSHAARDWSCWSGRRRPSRSRYETSLAGGGGRSWWSGCDLIHLSRGELAPMRRWIISRVDCGGPSMAAPRSLRLVRASLTC